MKELIERLRDEMLDLPPEPNLPEGDYLEKDWYITKYAVNYSMFWRTQAADAIERLTAERDAAIEGAAQEARYNTALRAEITKNGEHLRYVEGQETLRCAEVRVLTAERDSVVWGVDWAKNGDRTTVTIVKRHKDGTVEVVATEVDPK